MAKIHRFGNQRRIPYRRISQPWFSDKNVRRHWDPPQPCPSSNHVGELTPGSRVGPMLGLDPTTQTEVGDCERYRSPNLFALHPVPREYNNTLHTWRVVNGEGRMESMEFYLCGFILLYVDYDILHLVSHFLLLEIGNTTLDTYIFWFSRLVIQLSTLPFSYLLDRLLLWAITLIMCCTSYSDDSSSATLQNGNSRDCQFSDSFRPWTMATGPCPFSGGTYTVQSLLLIQPFAHGLNGSERLTVCLYYTVSVYMFRQCVFFIVTLCMSGAL